MMRMILSHEPNALDVMNSSGLWMTSTTSGCELKALNAMNNLGLWIILMTQDLMSLGR